MLTRFGTVLILLLGFYVSGVSAHVVTQCQGNAGTSCDQGDAFVALQAMPNDHCAALSAGGVASGLSVTHQAAGKRYTAFFGCKDVHGANVAFNQTHYTVYGSTCAERGSKVTTFFPPSGSVGCSRGCQVSYRDNGDDTTTYSPNGGTCDTKPDCSAQGKNMVWNGMLRVCQPVEPECPEGKVKVGNSCADEKPCPDGMALVNGSCKKEDNECPAGMIRSPLGSCIPGDGQCAAGEVRGPDGTCKRDSNNDGEPDPQDKDDPETFAGGDDCNLPPSCSGSPIMCGQARIQWRIECNTRRNNNISGGQCSQAGTPTCTGEKCNAMEYASLLMQWRSACAAEKLAAKGADSGTGTGNTDQNGNGVADALEGRGNVTAIGDNAADVSSAKSWGIPLSTDRLDTSNMFGGGGTCPEPPAITIMGKTVSSAEFPYFCRIAAIFRALILIFGAYTAIRILMGAFF